MMAVHFLSQDQYDQISRYLFKNDEGSLGLDVDELASKVASATKMQEKLQQVFDYILEHLEEEMDEELLALLDTVRVNYPRLQAGACSNP